MHSGKVIVITGVSRGLGHAMAEKFIELGHIVAGCARSREGINASRRAFGKPHDFRVVDAVSDSKVAAWAKRILETLGAPDLLLNNAGMINHPACLWSVPAVEFSQIIDINIKGVANVIRHFVPAMVERNRGVIVNFSSAWGRSTDAEVAPYCGTKWAIEGLTQAMAKELPSGMAAVPLNPGIIDTDMLRTCFGASAGAYPDAREWARVAVPFLLHLGPAANGRSLTITEMEGGN
jgi:NAD(P)-dependent dehydrogenase (short-subunit alcohol dehydrogenase family)